MSRARVSTDHDKQVLEQLTKIGIIKATKIAQTLQGNIWRASVTANTQSDHDTDHKDEVHAHSTQSIIVKVTDRHLSNKGVSKVGNKMVRVHENIENEAKILKHVTDHADCPKSIVKFHQFLNTDSDSLLFMEDGGSSLFDFVVKAHTLIRSGKIAVSEWIQMVKVIFKQMVECTEYLHSKKVCHLDISMENFLINNVMVDAVQINRGKNEDIKFVTDKVQVKLCDFGLAELFADDECLCAKWCGKVNYKSPEVVEKKQTFHAKQNDIWCLGVTLFMMMTGCPPWSVASASDDRYVNMTNGFLKYMLESWGVLPFVDDALLNLFESNMTNGFLKYMLESWGLLPFVDDALLNLFESIFKREADRIGLDEIKSHSWFADDQ
eukprot:CAMPEP_0197077676 /NCGR_PEP_ID=MMETSP1384-20130603/212737_1 /TAXON_ID=29189 /ORGANISM="Ammonia sp." /LENGTH=379 /DNA_ID=CAMNT_0042516541 /DNA_START=79 /DNA_END=1218 /DNA_ORIENTATION=+